MRIARLGLAVLTVGAWIFLLLQPPGSVSPLSAAILVPLAGAIAAVWVGFFSQRRLSIPAAVALELVLLCVAGFLMLVSMSFRGG